MFPFADQPDPILSWLLAAGGVIIIGIAKSGFGGGIGIISIPMLIFAFGNAEIAIGTMLPLLLAGDIFSVIHHFGKWDIRIVIKLVPGFLTGVTLASILFFFCGQISNTEQPLKIFIGVICLLWVVAELWRSRYAPQWKFKANWINSSCVGAFAGFVSALAHTAGPVIAIFLMGQNLAKKTFVATAVLYFLIGNSIKVPFYAGLGLIDTSTLYAGFILILFIPIGTLSGAWLHRHINEKRFKQVILILVFISAMGLLGLGNVIKNAVSPTNTTNQTVQPVTQIINNHK